MKKIIKKTICPECGRIETKEDIFYLVDVLEGRTKENPYTVITKGIEIDGIKYCPVCR